MQSRPPLQLDLTGPKPTTYDPPTTLPWETSSPSYTMRPKTQPERGIATTVHMLSDIGEQGWHSDGSTCSWSMWPGLKSWCRHHMWVEFVVQFFLSFALRGFYSGFRLSSKTNIFKFQCDEEWQTKNHYLGVPPLNCLPMLWFHFTHSYSTKTF